MIKIRISKTLQGKIRAGWPWIFRYQVESQSGEGPAGAMAVVYDAKNKFLALGLYDPDSDLCFRVLKLQRPGDIDSGFFRERLVKAMQLREGLEKEGTTGYRVLNGENDGFPGLVLDRYGDTGVVKLYTTSWLPHLDTLVPLFEEELPVRRLLLRLSRNTQQHMDGRGPWAEGTVLFGSPVTAPVAFLENGLKFEADVLKGHKTGFFLDQRENRQRIKDLSAGRRVLNVFSYSGAFSVYSFSGGAREVVEIDSNRHALLLSRETLKRNFPCENFNPPRFRQIAGDAFLELNALRAAGEWFDLVILDPPAFANKKKQRTQAVNAYRRLAQLGAGLTGPGKLLVAASCSSQVSSQVFFEVVASGVSAANRTFRELSRTGHAKDHPITFEGGQYLKAIYGKIG